MTTEQLIEQIRAALADDSALTAWCTATFGRPHMVCIDIDEENPPDPETDYPLVAVTDIRQIRGDDLRQLTWEVEIGVGVVQAEILTISNSRIMTGFVQVQTLREMAEDALYRSKIADLSGRGVSGVVGRYPVFVSGAIIPVTTLKSNRHRLPG